MATDLWQIRRRKKMTIDELANRAGINPSLIKAYELGQRPIAARDLEKLAKALLVDPWDIKELSEPPPRGPSRTGEQSSRYPGESSTSRYDFDMDMPRNDSPRYGRESGPSRYGSEAPPSRYGNDVGPSRYSDSGASRYGDSGPSRYGDDAGPSRYGGESNSYRYGSDQGRPSYGRPSSSPRYGGDRYPRYDDEGGAPRGPRPSRPPGRQYDDDRRMDRQRPPKKPRTPRRQPSSPARQSQIDHLKGLLIKLDMSGDELLRLAGKPLSMLTRKEAARLLSTCQAMLAEHKPVQPKGKRQRPYLPESVDEHELVYLTEVQLSNRPMRLTLFNGQTMEGQLLGFSPYALTIAQPDEQQVTIQKLAVAYYEVAGNHAAQDEEEDEE